MNCVKQLNDLNQKSTLQKTIEILIYAGIGSRETPEEILSEFTSFADWLSQRSDFICATGGALGADTAFINGAEKVHNWLPFTGYNGYRSLMPDVNIESLAMAKKYHPNWKACGGGAMMMHARNCNIVLGKDLNKPVKFILCWTKNGEVTGGTGQALRIAEDFNIPVINLGSGNYIVKVERLKEHITKELENFKTTGKFDLKKYYASDFAPDMSDMFL